MEFFNLLFTTINNGVKVSCIKFFSLFGISLLEEIPRSVITDAKDMDIFIFLLLCFKGDFHPPALPQIFTQRSFQQLEYGHSIRVATPTDMKGNIYSHIRAGRDRIWAGQTDRPNLAR